MDSLCRNKGTGKLMICREDASAIGSLVKAEESCQERIRIQRNKPLPGALRPESKRKSKAGKRRNSLDTNAVPTPALVPPLQLQAAVKADAPAESGAETSGEADLSHNQVAQSVTPIHLVTSA